MFPDPLVGELVKAVFEQVVTAWVCTEGIGFTVTVTVNDDPGHPFAVGVTV
jgi:hypothetical protein